MRKMDTNLLHPSIKKCKRIFIVFGCGKHQSPAFLSCSERKAALTLFNKEDKKYSICTFRRDGFFLVTVQERNVSREKNISFYFNCDRICNPGFLTVQVEPVGLLARAGPEKHALNTRT